MITIEDQNFLAEIIKIDNFAKFKDVKSKLILKKGNNNPNFIFSILIPTYKRVDLLKNALFSAINQTYNEPYEIIVVDNDNVSDGKEIIQLINQIFPSNLSKKISLKYYINEKNIKMAGNWNRAAELSNGKFIIMCHDDDELNSCILLEASKKLDFDKQFALAFLPKKIDLRKKGLKLHIYSLMRVVLKTLSIFTSFRKDKFLSLYDVFFRSVNAGCAGVFFNKKSLISIGGYLTKDVADYPDSYVLINYIRLFGIKYTKKIGCYYKIHPGLNDSFRNVENFSIYKYKRMIRTIPYISSNKKKQLTLEKKAISAYKFFSKDCQRYWLENKEIIKTNFSQQLKINSKMKLYDYFVVFILQLHFFRTYF